MRLQNQILCVGRLREAYWKAACDEYLKRLRTTAPTTVVEVKDDPIADRMSAADEQRLLAHEAERILGRIQPSDYVVVCAVNGATLSSEAFASHVTELEETRGVSRLTFVVGGALGLHETVYERANETLSFSRFTFPHQMMRCILLEQLYRVARIRQGAPYHR